MAKRSKMLAGRLTRKLMLWALFVLLGLSYFVFYFGIRSTHNFYSESYRNRTLVDKEYIRRVLSDVYVAVTNNVYYLEQNLDKPDLHKEVMARIVKNGTRVRSCGICFIKDYYYPQKDHRFCPFAWRNAKNPNVIEMADMGDSAYDYLDTEWFHSVIDPDSSYWSDPFYDGYDETTMLTAYMVPIHDKEGKVVAALGADVSLDWLTSKLNQTDSTVNANASFVSKMLRLKSHTYIIDDDGVFLTHPDQNHIMKGNFFDHIQECGESGTDGLVNKMKRGLIVEQEENEKYLFDGKKCYVFYTTVKYTDWMMVTVVPWQAIDMMDLLNASQIFLLIIIMMMVAVFICYYFIKSETKPLQQLTNVADNFAKGKFDIPIPEVKHKDEMHALCDSFEHLKESFSDRVKESATANKSIKKN